MLKTTSKRIGYIILHSVKVLSSFIVNIYTLKNYKKKKILIYTDSRGSFISRTIGYKNPFSSYAKYFIKKYNCKVYTCKEKHTTFFDFFYTYEKTKKDFDFVILNLGAVDFSPRPISQINSIIEEKKEKIEHEFSKQYYQKLKNFSGYNEYYLGEKTSAILPENEIEEVGARLNKIDNLIWITCNPVDTNWRGNYFKDRPKNINIVNSKSKLLLSYLTKNKIIDFTEWNLEEVHKFTCDNIHYSEEGMELIEQKLKSIIE